MNSSARKKALELTIVHADTPTLLRNLELNEIDAQVEIYNRLTDRLVSAGGGVCCGYINLRAFLY